QQRPRVLHQALQAQAPGQAWTRALRGKTPHAPVPVVRPSPHDAECTGLIALDKWPDIELRREMPRGIGEIAERMIGMIESGQRHEAVTGKDSERAKIGAVARWWRVAQGPGDDLHRLPEIRRQGGAHLGGDALDTG